MRHALYNLKEKLNKNMNHNIMLILLKTNYSLRKK